MGVLIKGADYLSKWAGNKNKQVLKAMEDAVKITAYKTSKDMRNELKGGQIGLKSIQIYRNDPRDKRYKKKKNINPLNILAVGIIYKFFKKELRATIGFHGDTVRTKWAQKFAGDHQTGITIPYTKYFKESLHKKGIHIRKETNTANVSARDIIGNFFAKHQRRVVELLKENFRRKLRGERI